MSQPDISNLQNCIEDARQGGLDQDPGPAGPLQYFGSCGYSCNNADNHLKDLLSIQTRVLP